MNADSPQLLQIREQIAQAVANQQPVTIHGGNTKAFYGQEFAGTALDIRPYSGIVSYEPTELVVTVCAGTPLTDLIAALAENGQCLPFEPPVFGADSTVGGAVAAGLSGPRRASAGSLRDYVLGINMIDASGQWLAFGGQVMKNVAGYDVSRLLCGSLGVLGVIAQVSLKVLPLPALERTVRLPVAEAEAIRLMNQLAGMPLPLSATCWHQNELTLRFSGAALAVDAAIKTLLDYPDAAEFAASDPARAAAFWAALRDQQAEFFEGELPCWRLSVPATAPVLDLPGEQLHEWGGALRWWRTQAPANAVRAAAQAVGGSASLFRGGDKTAGVFEPLPTPLALIHKRLKAQFDPQGIFNPGRMYPEF